MKKLLSRKVPVYEEHEREMLRAAGRFNAQVMDFIRPFVQPGMTTGRLDRLVDEYTRDHGHVPACLGYKGYPRSICTSINDIVCHGIPDDTELREGDIVNVDLTTVVSGWYGDQSETFLIGCVSDEVRRLVQVTFDSLYVGIHAIVPFGRIIDIGRAIYRYARDQRFDVVREYQGHGIGREFHQLPSVPHYPDTRTYRDVVTPGMCFTVEPMLNAGTWKTVQDKVDNWTVRTADGRLSAQFEHTILMTEDGPEILTPTLLGPQEGHRF